MHRAFCFALFCVLLFILAGCGGGGSSAPPAQISVTISPTTASVAVGQTKQFTASVTGTSNTGVTWQVNAMTGGNATVGTISASGLYTAPNVIPNSNPVTVTAVSQADTSKSASAPVTITAQGNTTVLVSPNPASVEVFQTQQFTATVNGQPSSAVTWQVNGVTGGSATTGTISSSGLYHAPNSVPTTSTSGGGSTTTTVTVTGVSQASPSSSGSATVTVFAPNQNAQFIPVTLGTTGGNAKDSSTSGGRITCCGGTLGSLVSRGGNQYILSNNHVLARTDLATVGENIIQPGLIDANCSAAGTITVGHLSQFVNLEANNNHPVADAAVAQVVLGTVDPQGTILELGGTTSGGMPTDGPPHAGPLVTVVAGRAVAKSGRSTGLTCSSVFSTVTSISIIYQKGCGTGKTFTAMYSSQVAVTGAGFSAEGDSGSLIVAQDTADPVALLYAGSDTETVGNPISTVLTALADPGTGATPVFVGSASTHAVAACSLPGPQAAMAARLAVQAVQPSSEDMQRAVLTRDLYAPALMAHPEVQALGIGASLDHPGEPAILFFVTTGQPRTNLPPAVDDIRTRIIEGDLFAQRGVLSPDQSAALEQSAVPPQLVYPISDAEFARAKAVHAAHAEEWMKQPGVQGFGIGSSADAPGEAALVIFLIRGVAHPPIPATIEGVRMRVRESSRFRAGFGERASQRGCSLGSAAAKPAKPAATTQP